MSFQAWQLSGRIFGLFVVMMLLVQILAAAGTSARVANLTEDAASVGPEPPEPPVASAKGMTTWPQEIESTDIGEDMMRWVTARS